MSAENIPFDEAFRALTGYKPMGWQHRLYDRFVTNNLPQALDIPTGLGKTSVMAIWLIALAVQAHAKSPRLPRRLIYVVNRRTVVDQATDDAMKLRTSSRDSGSLTLLRCALDSLCVDPKDPASPLAISTLRGELADNREWQADPARPTIVIGTVDMIGSRLLFSSYSGGWKMRAFNAGMIGHDTLIVHDEAHLTPAFGKLINAIEIEQSKQARALRVLDLSATQRQGFGPTRSTSAFQLTEKDQEEPLVRCRIKAAKALHFQDVDDRKLVPRSLADAALSYRAAMARVLIYVRTPGAAKETHDLIVKALDEKRHVALLTGTLRGHERDELARCDLKYFLANAQRAPLEQTRYLVATSAGEVGVNLDADHLICDLTTLDSMIQRIGRVNRLGRDDTKFVARIDILDAPGDGEDEDARRATRLVLQSLPEAEHGGRDGSPSALRRISTSGTFSKEPRVLKITPILLDKWALTSIRGDMPGRPAVDPWLHGIEQNRPETIVAWRHETADMARLLQSGDTRAADMISEWLAAHPVKPQERLRESSNRAAEEFKKMASRLAKAGQTLFAVLIGQDKIPCALDIAELPGRVRDDNARVILPPEAGGLSGGMLEGVSSSANDVADILSDSMAIRGRARLRRSEDGEWSVALLGDRADDLAASLATLPVGTDMSLNEVGKELLSAVNQSSNQRQALTFVEKNRLRVMDDSDDDSGIVVALLAFGAAKSAETALESSAAAAKLQTLDEHLKWASMAAERIVFRLGLEDHLKEAVVLAARWHDKGKNRRQWQRAIGNSSRSEPLAKTAHGRFDFRECPGYRHEFGSVIDAADDKAIESHPLRDLILHLIACHHGRARPHFLKREWDPNSLDDINASAADETMRRYSRLSRRFGPWRLAWLEALMKAADVIATKRGEMVKDLPYGPS
ncbi:MAG TPA: type I-U CRISPR-associated helicase/endonuclease Cas3 [Rhizomicrobium sp.]|nr:type I-U CRISPR-associated helicase/endonuclease Cas3 [Rhizomicrobium sp.]